MKRRNGGLKFESYDPPTIATVQQQEPESLEPAKFPLFEINGTQERSLKNKLAWGAYFGELLASSQILLYWFFAATSPNHFSDELDKLNFITESSTDSLFARTLFSYMTYFAAAAVVSALGNVARKTYQNRNKPSEAYGEQFSEIKQSDDINKLFDLTANDRQLKLSWKQNLLKATVFLTFLAPNFIYDYAYKDVGDAAIALLPDYGMPIYKALNQHAGDIGFIMNFALNQWFAFTILNLVITFYNLIQLTRKNYHKNGNASWTAALKNAVSTEASSIVSSLSFFFLALDDPQLSKKPPIMQFLIPLSAFCVYGAVLNTEGSIGLLTDMSRFWSWLNTMPEPLRKVHKAFKENKFGYYVLGYVAYNFTEYFKELGYYVGLNGQYIDDNDLELPKSLSKNDSSLLSHLDIQEKDSADPSKRPKYSGAELETEVNKRIRNLPRVDESGTQVLKRLILDAKKDLDAARIAPSTAADVWKYGRVRKPIAKTFALLGPLGLSVVLFGYYFLVNEKLTEKIYNGAFNMGLSQFDASARMASLYLFYPFIKLVHDSGYSAMEKMFNGFEHKVTEIYHSLQVLFKYKKSDDFDYSDRFHPTTRKEGLLFAFGTLIFSLQLTAFLVTPSSSGTVLYLLDERGYLNPFTQTVAFWFTALFNSFGVSSFLSYGKEKIIEKVFYRDRSELFQENEEFFTGARKSPGCKFDLDNLTETFTSTSFAV